MIMHIEFAKFNFYYYPGHDSVLAKLDIFEIAMLRNFSHLDKQTRDNLTEKISQRVDFEEQVKIKIPAIIGRTGFYD